MTLKVVKVMMVTLATVAFGMTGCDGGGGGASISTPCYFIAIHNEPDTTKANIDKNFVILKEMIAKADGYNIRLTLMFTGQWLDYFKEHNLLETVQGWQAKGHEISVHHHSTSNSGWDGYTSKAFDLVQAERVENNLPVVNPVGTFIDLANKFLGLNLAVRIVSGCVNEESDKEGEMPDEVVYATCSGFLNFDLNSNETWQWIDDHYLNLETSLLQGREALAGRNDFIIQGQVNGITRKWIRHYPLMLDVKSLSGQTAVQGFEATPSSSIYGVAVHSMLEEIKAYDTYLDYLHQQDPTGNSSRTVSEVIDQNLIPTREIDSATLLAPHVITY